VALKISFSELWLCLEPLPFGVKGLQVLEGIDPDTFGLRTDLQNTQTLYQEISFFWSATSPDGISAKTHIVIVDHFIFVLLLSMVSRYFAWLLFVNIYT